MEQQTRRPGAMDTGAGTDAPRDNPDEVKVLSCTNCEGPVASTAGKCFACGFPLTGKEFAYIHKLPSGPDITAMVKWWAIFCGLAIAIGGFSFGMGTNLAVTIISMVYGVRVLRAYFS